MKKSVIIIKKGGGKDFYSVSENSPEWCLGGIKEKLMAGNGHWKDSVAAFTVINRDLKNWSVFEFVNDSLPALRKIEPDFAESATIIIAEKNPSHILINEKENVVILRLRNGLFYTWSYGDHTGTFESCKRWLKTECNIDYDLN